MVAFRCPCGRTTGLIDMEHTVPSKKEGHSYVVCSKACRDYYSDRENLIRSLKE